MVTEIDLAQVNVLTRRDLRDDRDLTGDVTRTLKELRERDLITIRGSDLVVSGRAQLAEAIGTKGEHR
jgi:hypothetical protein